MAGINHTTEDDFIAWLSEKVTSAQLSELYLAYMDVDVFCKGINILNDSLLKTTDFPTVKKIFQTVEKNKIFKMKYKKNINKIIKAVRYYYNYIKEVSQNNNDDFEKSDIDTHSNNATNNDKQSEKKLLLSAERYINNDESDKAYSIYKDLAERGNPDAMYYIGNCYLDGEFVEQNDEQALMWFEKAADMNHSNAVNAIGVYYHNAKHLKEKYFKAIEWYKRGAELGNKYSQCNLGWYYEYGLGCTSDLTLAEKYYELSANQGYDDASNYLLRIKKKLSKPNNFATEHRETNSSSESKNCDGNVLIVNFFDNTSYSYTKPINLKYFDDICENITSWTDLYIKLLSFLYEDYPHVLKINTVIGNSSRIDIGDYEISKRMISPKQLPNEQIFIETNYSAKDIISKIGKLLNMCNVDYENVEIQYIAKNNSEENSLKRANTNRNALSFSTWLEKNIHMAKTTSLSYASAINNCESYASLNRIGSAKLYDNSDKKDIMNTIELLLNNKDFLAYNENQHNRFSAALKKYMEFLENNVTTENNVNDRGSLSFRLRKYIQILKENYSKGFRINSILEIKRFRKYWMETYEHELSLDDNIIIDKISRLTIQCGNLAYLPEMMLSDESKIKLLNYINESFNQGTKAIYYNALYNTFKDIFQNERINNPEMLKTYLTYINDGLYVIKRSFIASDNNVEVDAKQEVRNLLINKGMPISIDVIYEELPHLNKNNIYFVVSGSNSDEFVKNSKGEYFHADIIYFSQDELEWISSIIQNAISEKDYMSGSELVSTIENKYPDIKEKYPYLTPIGLRDTIKYKLGTMFSFKGQVISSIDKQLSMYEVFANYALTHNEFTLTQLNTLKTELDTIIYFDAIYDNAIRINEEEFVSKDSITFNTSEIDSVIDRFCIGEYVALNSIDQFGAFPFVGYLWNKYLLESYVYSFSNKFKLMHACFNASSANGAVVKKNTSFEKFDDLLTDFLAKSTTLLNKEDALQYFCGTGLLARRSCSTIDNILATASILREQKGN